MGASEENRHRNQSENIVPYDRNRVHLSPMPGLKKEINTYINASFIEVRVNEIMLKFTIIPIFIGLYKINFNYYCKCRGMTVPNNS